jgi:hypothetical protein
MADEITASVSLSYEDTENTTGSLAVVNLVKTVTTKKITRLKQNVGITEEAIDLGDISAPGYALFINRDTTNFINLKVATSGAIFAKLLPDTDGDGNGGFACLQLGSGAQAPFAIADTAACQMDVFIIST